MGWFKEVVSVAFICDSVLRYVCMTASSLVSLESREGVPLCQRAAMAPMSLISPFLKRSSIASLFKFVVSHIYLSVHGDGGGGVPTVEGRCLTQSGNLPVWQSDQTVLITS